MAKDGAAEDRPKSKTVGPLVALWPFLKPHGRDIALALGALLLAAFFTLAVPVALRRVVDGFTEAQAELIDTYFLSFFVLALLLSVATAARFYFVTRLGERVIADLRTAVYAHVIGLNPAFFEEMRTGETLSRLTTDAAVVQSAVGSAASVALRNVIVLVGGIGLLLVTSPWLTFLVLLAVPLIVGPIILLGRRVRALSRTAQDTVAEASGFAGETLQSAAAVQAFTFEDSARGRFGAAVERSYRAAALRILMRSVLTAIVIFLVTSAVVGVLWLGARSVINGAMSAGELVQFMLYAVFVAGAVGALAEIWGELQRAAGATERLIELLQTAPEIEAPETPSPAPAPALLAGSVAANDARSAGGERARAGPGPAVVFDAVSFRYPSRPETLALDSVSISVAPGETVAIVGPSGAGKSTLIHLLFRFADPEQGAVRLGGVDLRDMAPTDFRRRLSLVPQEPAIFAASAAENIRFGRPEASDAEVRAAAEAAAADMFISALPKGYETEVGERGVMLSGGQRQRIAIARAILRDAPVLLLDEATSALDAESERAVQEAVGRLAANRTTIAIAHRLATVKQADRIIVLDGGRVVAEGRHDALVAEGGLYARLARLQFTA